MTLKDKFVLVLNIFELLSCIAGFIYYQKLKDTKWRWFVFFLVFTFATEMVAKYFNYQFGKGSSTPIYRYGNIPVTFLFFLWLFYKWFEKSKYQQIAVAGMGIYCIAWIVEEFFVKDSKYYGSLSYLIAILFILSLSVVYYITLIKSQSDIDYQQDLMFWVVTGILTYYFVSSSLFAIRHSLSTTTTLLYTFWIISSIFNYVMYALFIIGFKSGKPWTSYSSYSQVLPSLS